MKYKDMLNNLTPVLVQFLTFVSEDIIGGQTILDQLIEEEIELTDMLEKIMERREVTEKAIEGKRQVLISTLVHIGGIAEHTLTDLSVKQLLAELNRLALTPSEIVTQPELLLTQDRKEMHTLGWEDLSERDEAIVTKVINALIKRGHVVSLVVLFREDLGIDDTATTAKDAGLSHATDPRATGGRLHGHIYLSSSASSWLARPLRKLYQQLALTPFSGELDITLRTRYNLIIPNNWKLFTVAVEQWFGIVSESKQ